MSVRNPIVFYDGECGMCHGMVRFAVARDGRGRFRYAPINGETWKTLIEDGSEPDTNTIHLLDERGHHVRSSAVCRLLIGFGGGWKFLGCLLWLVPRPLRNLGYRMVASIRYRVAGRVDACTIPAPDAVDRLLP